MPQTRAAASPGNTINLMVSFRNSAEDLAVASGVVCRIFDPDGDPTDNATATDTLAPTTPTTGLYLVDYLIPEAGIDGIWSDKWTGILDAQALEYVFNFNVTSSGIIGDTQLQNNNVVTIQLDDSIPSADGDTLGEDYYFYFTTAYSPTYTNYQQIMLQIGRYIEDLPADTIWRAILSASLESDRFTRGDPANAGQSSWYEFTRRLWVRCRTEELLLVEAMKDFDIKSKELGDLKVTWGGKGLETALDRALACKAKYQEPLEAGGVKIKKMQVFVKGDLDDDRPVFGREHVPPDADPYSPGVPAKNVNRYTSTYRRSMGSYKKRW